ARGTSTSTGSYSARASCPSRSARRRCAPGRRGRGHVTSCGATIRQTSRAQKSSSVSLPEVKGIGRALLRPWVALVGIVAGSAALLSLGTSRVHEWAVMTDELLYAKLARHIAESGSPVPTLHDQHVGFLGVVYPIVL